MPTLTRTVPLLDGVFAGEFARGVLDLQMDPTVDARVEVLRELANEGQLTPAERAEYEQYVDDLDLLAALRARARAALKRQAP